MPAIYRAALVAIALACPAIAQVPLISYSVEPYHLDSGYLHNPTDREVVVFDDVVEVADRDWIRLEFKDTNLPGGSRLRLTSRADGAVQWFDAHSLVDYANGSAYFNGNAVRVELLAAPRTRANRVQVVRVVAGDAEVGGPDTTCGTSDDRRPSDDPRQGRQFPNGCTAWLINATTIVTAGHCLGASPPMQIHFNVPLSTGSGGLVLPPPAEQFPYDMRTRRALNRGQGADWAVCAVNRNSNHHLYPGQWTGSWYQLGQVPPSTSGQVIRITGYGTVSSPVTPTWNQVQKTHTGPMAGLTATSLRYRTDTSGGNSGSPVIQENTGLAIGIHTHGGCSRFGGSNSGTRIDRGDLQTAIAAVGNIKVAGFFTPFGSGCPGTAGTPRLSSSTFPDVGNTMRLDVTSLPVNQPGMMFTGSSTNTWMGQTLPFSLDAYGMTGCSQLVSFEVALPAVSSALGTTTVAFAIAERYDLIGLSIHHQYMTLDPGANPAGATLSNAATSRIGG